MPTCLACNSPCTYSGASVSEGCTNANCRFADEPRFSSAFDFKGQLWLSAHTSIVSPGMPQITNAFPSETWYKFPPRQWHRLGSGAMHWSDTIRIPTDFFQYGSFIRGFAVGDGNVVRGWHGFALALDSHTEIVLDGLTVDV